MLAPEGLQSKHSRQPAALALYHLFPAHICVPSRCSGAFGRQTPLLPQPGATGSRGHRSGLGGYPGLRGTSQGGTALGTEGHSAPSSRSFCKPFFSPSEAVLHQRQKPPPSFFSESTLIPFPFSSKFPMKIYYSEWLRCQPNEQGIGISFLLAFQPLVRLALSKKSRFSMISVPLSCRYYLFSGWQHVGKPIKNQYPGAWGWVVIHLFKTSKEWGGQLSLSHVKLQGKGSLSALKTSQMWQEKQLTKGKEGGEETEMSKQKTAIVPILH